MLSLRPYKNTWILRAFPFDLSVSKPFSSRSSHSIKPIAKLPIFSNYKEWLQSVRWNATMLEKPMGAFPRMFWLFLCLVFHLKSCMIFLLKIMTHSISFLNVNALNDMLQVIHHQPMWKKLTDVCQILVGAGKYLPARYSHWTSSCIFLAGLSASILRPVSAYPGKCRFPHLPG